MNVLILSAGTRNKIVQYFKKELEGVGTVVATDCSELAPAIYEADKYYIVPKITEANYIDKILEICKIEKINALFTLIDPEISLIARNMGRFKENGILPIMSDYEQVEMCFDKYKMYQFLTENNLKTPKSYINKKDFIKELNEGKINFPIFVKPVRGSASININKIENKEELDVIWDKEKDLMIQEFMDGQEYGADVYIDMVSGEIVSIFVKKKIKMRAGETDKSVSIRDDEMFKFVQNFVRLAGFKGIIDIDIFKKGNEYYISEVNPRFGGGYPHAYELGINFPKMIVNNMKGNKNSIEIGNYVEGKYMMKYNEIKIM